MIGATVVVPTEDEEDSLELIAEEVDDKLELIEDCDDTDDAKLELRLDERALETLKDEDTWLEELIVTDDCDDSEEEPPPPPQADNIKPNATNHADENFNLYIGVTFIVINWGGAFWLQQLKKTIEFYASYRKKNRPHL